MPKDYKNILLVKNRALGDAILTMASAQAVRDYFPHAMLSFATPSWTAPLFNSLEHPFEQVIPFDLSTLSGILDFYSDLLNGHFDLIYEFHQRPSSARILKTYTITHDCDYYFHNHHCVQERKSIIRRDLDGICRALSLSKFDNCFVPKVISKSPKRIILGVVATRDTKMLPLDKFYTLAERLVQEFGSSLFIPLGPSDYTLKQKLLQMEFDKLATIIELPLDQLVTFVRSCDLYIGNDTGLKHLAAFLQLKTISFFGPEEPVEWHPYDRLEHPYLFLPDVECRYDKAHFCGLDHCSTMECMNFAVDDILRLVAASSHKTQNH